MPPKTLNKIMVIEDEEDILTIIKFALERLAQLNVAYFNSGRDALQQIEDFAPDLILMDMMMPEMDGLTILKELRQNHQQSHIPVVFMTARAQPNEINEYLKAGALAVITKPFDPITLADRLRAIWNEQNQGSSHE